MLMEEGRPQRQAVAIALSHARKQGCRIKDTRRGRSSGQWPLEVAANRLFIGVFPAGIGYADRARTVTGDYARVGFLPFKTLVFEPARDADPKLVAEARAHAAKIAARRGQPFEVSASGQTVILGRSSGLSQMPFYSHDIRKLERIAAELRARGYAAEVRIMANPIVDGPSFVMSNAGHRALTAAVRAAR